MDLLDTTAAVDTPERVRFRYRLAGPGQRSVAWLVDFLIRAVVFLVLAMVALALALVPGFAGVGAGLVLLVLFLLEWFYGVVFETLLGGRTPGKILLSLRVVRSDGAPARFPDFLLRNLLRGVDFLPMLFGIGVLTMLIDRRMRRIGDLVAGTVVVSEERAAVLGGVVVDPPVTEEERQAMPARVDLDREEIALVESFLRRRRSLGPERAEELAWLFGPALSQRTGIEAPTWVRVLTLAYARATGKDRE